MPQEPVSITDLLEALGHASLRAIQLNKRIELLEQEIAVLLDEHEAQKRDIQKLIEEQLLLRDTIRNAETSTHPIVRPFQDDSDCV
jgi:hypothetical protein